MYSSLCDEEATDPELNGNPHKIVKIFANCLIDSYCKEICVLSAEKEMN